MALVKAKAKSEPTGGFMKAFQNKRKDQTTYLKAKYGEVTTLHIGDPAIDWAMGSFARGGANLAYGPSKSGKSTKMLRLAAIEQKLLKKTTGRDHWVVIYDSEYAHDMQKPATFKRWKELGLDPEYTLAISSNLVDELFADIGKLEADLAATRRALIDGEDAVEALEKKGEFLPVAAIVVDSWGGIQPEQARGKINAGNAGSAGNSYGGNAKTINPLIQQVLRLCAAYGISGFHVQHCIENMDKNAMTGAYNGPKWILLGGQKLRYLAHAIMFVEGVEGKNSWVDANGDLCSESGGVAVGKMVRVRCEKSRVQVEGRKSETWMNFTNAEYVRKEITNFGLASNIGVIIHPSFPDLDKKGKPKLDADGKPITKTNQSWWAFAGEPERKFNGQKQMIAAMVADPKLYDAVWQGCLIAQKTDSVGVALGSEEGVSGDSGDDEIGSFEEVSDEAP